jgi:hypothetical protein
MGRFQRRAAPRPLWRVAAVGVVAVLGVALHTSVPASAFQRRAVTRTGSPARAAVPMSVFRPASPARIVPDSPDGSGTRVAARGGGSGKPVSAEQTAASSFRQIILPDLLIVAPKGLTAQQISALHAIRGVRDMITFDGAQITAGGRPVSVIGVNPATFRSWVPLRTASDQAFWTALADGDFVASATAASDLNLTPGDYYRLVGASTEAVKYGLDAKLGLAGVDLLVNQAMSVKLGLVHQVAGLISAPGLRLSALTSKVSKILGPGGRIEVLRGQLAVAARVYKGTEPTTYVQLFQASAAEYCPGLSWTVLAAIGQIESADGQNMGPSSAGALGPMQFLPSTWAAWGIDAFGQTGPPDVWNPYDAVPSAARMLCADGAAAGGQSLYNAIFDYNHADWYVNEVLALAGEYATDYS